VAKIFIEIFTFCQEIFEGMAAVYKQLTKNKSAKEKDASDAKMNGDTLVQNKQRVLMLSSRGVTHR